jgi:hypothetical protein
MKARQLPPAAATGNQRSSKVELMALRESIKAQARGARSTVSVKSLLDRIETQYGKAERERALREFNSTFHNIPRAPGDKNPRHA